MAPNLSKNKKYRREHNAPFAISYLSLTKKTGMRQLFFTHLSFLFLPLIHSCIFAA